MGSDINVSNNWFERNPKKILFILYLVLLCFLELIVRIFAFYGFIPIKQFPTSNTQLRFLDDLHEHFGVWHYPDRTSEVHSPCFSVTYTSNSYGARDVERTKISNGGKRIIALGDSFVEGVGVEMEQRLTNLLENDIKAEVLNFGTSGDFGSIQQWILYKELASQFEHDEVHIYLLPDNDFEDNELRNFSRTRYRPYLRKNEQGEFETYYSVLFNDRETSKNYSTGKRIRGHLYNNIYILNVIRQAGYLIDSVGTSLLTDHTELARVPYDDFTELDLEQLAFTYSQIVSIAEPRPVKIFIIPRITDMEAYLDNKNKRKITEALQAFSNMHPSVEVHDMLPYFLNYAKENRINPGRFFHSCDGHWSVLGNRVAADFVVEAIKSQKRVAQLHH
jgi:hypothetical protein